MGEFRFCPGSTPSGHPIQQYVDSSGCPSLTEDAQLRVSPSETDSIPSLHGWLSARRHKLRTNRLRHKHLETDEENAST